MTDQCLLGAVCPGDVGAQLPRSSLVGRRERGGLPCDLGSPGSTTAAALPQAANAAVPWRDFTQSTPLPSTRVGTARVVSIFGGPSVEAAAGKHGPGALRTRPSSVYPLAGLRAPAPVSTVS